MKEMSKLLLESSQALDHLLNQELVKVSLFLMSKACLSLLHVKWYPKHQITTKEEFQINSRTKMPHLLNLMIILEL